jgi:hypothetical protein
MIRANNQSSDKKRWKTRQSTSETEMTKSKDEKRPLASRRQSRGLLGYRKVGLLLLSSSRDWYSMRMGSRYSMHYIFTTITLALVTFIVDTAQTSFVTNNDTCTTHTTVSPLIRRPIQWYLPIRDHFPHMLCFLTRLPLPAFLLSQFSISSPLTSHPHDSIPLSPITGDRRSHSVPPLLRHVAWPKLNRIFRNVGRPILFAGVVDAGWLFNRRVPTLHFRALSLPQRHR